MMRSQRGNRLKTKAKDNEAIHVEEDEVNVNPSDTAIIMDTNTEDTIVNKDTNRHPLNEIEKTVADEVEKFWKAKTFSDLDIHCGMDGGVIQAHCVVLASISPVFKRVLKPIYDHYTDNERAVLIVPGIQSTVLKKFLDCVYDGNTDEAFVDKELEFLEFTADRIEDICEEIPKQELQQNSGNAVMYSLDQLKLDDLVRNPDNHIWEFFSTVDKKLATCDDCSEAIVIEPWGHVGGLISHLKRFHQPLFDEYEAKISKNQSLSQNNINAKIVNRKRKQSDIESHWNEMYEDGDETRAIKYERMDERVNTVGKRRKKKRRGKPNKNDKEESIDGDWEPKALKGRGKTMKRKEKRSLCWRYFSAISDKQAQCNKCEQLVQTLGGSTTIMSRHLTKQHPDIFSEFSKLREIQLGQKNPGGKIAPLPKSEVTLGPKSSLVWDFFVPAGHDAAKCHICEQEYVIGASSGTSQLLRHIIKEHEETYSTLKEKRERIEDNIMLCSMHHPMWKYYTELENNQYSCNRCNGEIIIKSDTLLVKPLEEHMQTQVGHEDQWKAYKEEMEDTEFVQKLKHAIRFVEAAKYSKIWELYEKVDEDHAKCKTCSSVDSTSPETSTILQTFSNYQSGLMRHAKHCHPEMYDKFKEREGRIRFEEVEKGIDRVLQVNTPKPKPATKIISSQEPSKLEDKLNMNQVDVIYDGKVLSVDEQTGTILENILQTNHEENKANLENKEAGTREDLLFSTKKFPGAPKPSIVWNFFHMITQDSTQCKICDKIYITPKGCTSAMKRHLKVNHGEYCKRWLLQQQAATNDTTNTNTDTATTENHPIWKHYEEIENDTYQCIHCGVLVKLDNAQIDSLEEHLKETHNTSPEGATTNVYEEYSHDKLTVTYTKKKDVKPIFAHPDLLDDNKLWDFPDLEKSASGDEGELIEIRDGKDPAGFASNAPQHEIIVGGEDSSVSSTFRMATGSNNLPRRSAVWFFFSEATGTSMGTGAKCNPCGKVISTTCGSTSLMIRHLKKFHPELSKEFEKYRNLKDLPESITVKFSLPRDVNQFGEVVSSILSSDVSSSNGGGNANRNARGMEEGDEDEDDDDIPDDPDLLEQNTNSNTLCYKPRRSAVWLFFTAEADKEYSRCNKCNTRLKMHSGTTSILFRHLKGFHPKRYRKFMDIRVARGEIPEWKDTDRSKDESPKKRTKGSPIWNFFTENANESATCNICLQCMSIRHKSTTHLNRHLKSYHPSTYKELRALFTARVAFQKGSDFHHNDASIGLEFTLVKDFYIRVNQELVQCTTCSASLKLPKMGAGGTSSSLWHHLKNAHEDVHESLTLEKEKIEETMKLSSEKHPVWKYYKEIETSTLVCLQCKALLELQELALGPLEEHMFENHIQSYQSFKEEMKSKDVIDSLKKAAEISSKSGLSKLIWSLYKEVSEDHVKCKECGIILGTKDSKSSGLLNHIRHNHNQLLQTMTSEKGKEGRIVFGPDGKPIVKINVGECICENCDKVFSSSTALAFHERIFHLSLVPYKCEDCDKTFTRSDELSKHQKNHGSKFLCTYCGSQFNTKSSRLRHEQFSHFDVRKFACSQCGKRFHTPQQVRNHLRTHTGEKPFQVSTQITSLHCLSF